MKLKQTKDNIKNLCFLFDKMSNFSLIFDNFCVTIITIDIDSYIDDNNNYIVEKILLETDSPEKNEDIKSTLYEKLQFEVEMM